MSAVMVSWCLRSKACIVSASWSLFDCFCFCFCCCFVYEISITSSCSPQRKASIASCASPVGARCSYFCVTM